MKRPSAANERAAAPVDGFPDRDADSSSRNVVCRLARPRGPPPPPGAQVDFRRRRRGRLLDAAQEPGTDSDVLLSPDSDADAPAAPARPQDGDPMENLGREQQHADAAANGAQQNADAAANGAQQSATPALTDSSYNSDGSDSSDNTDLPSEVSLVLQGPLLERAKQRVVALHRMELHAVNPAARPKSHAAKLGWTGRYLRDRDWEDTKWYANNVLSAERLRLWQEYVNEHGRAPRDGHER